MTTNIETPTEPPVAEAERSRHDIFRYSRWVHLAPDDCPLVRALAAAGSTWRQSDLPTCKDPNHFHAWVRLPNPYQVRDINEKARAARARVIRMLRDPESDAGAILDEELDGLRDESVRDILADEILDKDFATHYDQAVSGVLDMDDEGWQPEDEDDEPGEIPKLYAHIEADQEEYQRQLELPDDQRDETFAELQSTVAAYARDVEAVMNAITAPIRESLAARPIDELVAIARKDRIEAKANEVYLHTWNTWQWYVCTYEPVTRGTPARRKFRDINHFKYETPNEVIVALRAAFTDLEMRLSRGGGSQGNS